MKKRWILLFLMLLLSVRFVFAEVNCDGTSNREECLAISKQIDELDKQLQLSRAAVAPLESEVERIGAKIKSIQAQVSASVKKMEQTEVEIKMRGEKVSTQYAILAVKLREMYKRIRSRPLWTGLISSTSMGEARRELGYRQDSNDKDRQLIVAMVQEISKLEDDKKKLQAQKEQLTKLQVELDKQNNFFLGEVKKAKSYQSDLSSKIAALSAQQQSLLAEKTGTFSTTVGDVPLADDPASSPTYNPGFSPAFAAFSFGAPHFKGMSQYGAYGRAKSGQNAEDILRAYYGGVEIKKDYDSGKQIGVAGYGRMDIETYTKRIYEMPNSWGDSGGFEALKAQAVAARTYALAWTNEGTGGNICTDQGCQVYKNSNKGGKWEEAVNATKGWVLVKDGKLIKPWYASTSGGYQESYDALAHRNDGSSYKTPAIWDTPSGRGGWTSQAYEKTAGSPWFYKAWYKGSSGDSCGKSHPWFTSEQMADILNSIVVYRSGNGSEHILPIDYVSCFGKSGEPWDYGKMRQEAASRGKSFSKVSGVSVTYAENGVTAKVSFETDGGNFEVSGQEFYKVFNLRAHGKISLKSGLFNIEKK